MTTWRKSSYTHDNSCVELAEADEAILVRNSNHRDAGTLTVTPAAMAALIEDVKADELDDLA